MQYYIMTYSRFSNETFESSTLQQMEPLMEPSFWPQRNPVAEGGGREEEEEEEKRRRRRGGEEEEKEEGINPNHNNTHQVTLIYG